MTQKDLLDLISSVKKLRAETPNIELKAAKKGSPEKLYDTFSSFSNTSGGIILFGIDEKNNYEVCGVQDPEMLEKKIVEQANEMCPVVRPLISFCNYNGKIVIAAEIVEMEAIAKPCFYQGKGKFKGSYIRVGEADLPMTEYEIYSYDAFKQQKEDELRTKDRVGVDNLDEIALGGFFAKAITSKPNFANIDRSTLLKLNGITDTNGQPTVCGLMMFGRYPQILGPNLDIVAVKNAGTKYAQESTDGLRFVDNKRFDGTVVQMLNSAMQFVHNNMQIATIIDENGQRKDRPEYPMKAIREIILNALIHRDYSIYSENDPIRIDMYSDRIEVSNPGGLYGRLSLEDLGNAHSDVRNPFIAAIAELMEISENRYSGIPTIYSEMEKAGLEPPVFENARGVFKVTLYNAKHTKAQEDPISEKIVSICKQPQAKEDLAKAMGFDENHPSYFINKYVLPLINKNILRYTMPDKPKSKYQKIVAV